MQLLALCAATRSNFLFSNLCSGILGNGEVRPAETLGSEVSGTHLCNYSFVGGDVAHSCM